MKEPFVGFWQGRLLKLYEKNPPTIAGGFLKGLLYKSPFRIRRAILLRMYLDQLYDHFLPYYTQELRQDHHSR